MRMVCVSRTMLPFFGRMICKQYSYEMKKLTLIAFYTFSFGNIRRFPLASERNRTGGAGVYYHVCLFSYKANCA